MEKIDSSYINTSKNETIINYLIDEHLPSKKIDSSVSLLINKDIKKYKKKIDDIKNSSFYINDEIKVAYFSFIWDIPIDETILTIRYIKREYSENKN